jgi:hypothetical protein
MSGSSPFVPKSEQRRLVTLLGSIDTPLPADDFASNVHPGGLLPPEQ